MQESDWDSLLDRAERQVEHWTKVVCEIKDAKERLKTTYENLKKITFNEKPMDLDTDEEADDSDESGSITDSILSGPFRQPTIPSNIEYRDSAYLKIKHAEKDDKKKKKFSYAVTTDFKVILVKGTTKAYNSLSALIRGLHRHYYTYVKKKKEAGCTVHVVVQEIGNPVNKVKYIV